MSKSALVFCGAGASFAVNKQKYPTTVGFFQDHLSDSIKKDPFFRMLGEYVLNARVRNGERASDVKIDIEELLFAAGDLEETFRRFHESENHVAYHIANHQEFRPYVGHNNNVYGPMSNALGSIRALKNAINERIHDVYETIPTEQELSGNWTPLLRHLDEGYSRVDLFTTNYDLVLETAIARTKFPVDRGVHPIGYETLNVAMWQSDWDPIGGVKGLLTKLHGSLTWAKGKADRIDVGSPRHPGTEREVAIYPGYKGESPTEPFRSFHDYLVRRLDAADTIAFIGFAFRDQYLNSLFRRLTDSKKLIAVVDPVASKISLPFANSTTARIDSGFSDSIESLRQIFRNG
jgi:SIR2-like domain